MSAALGAYSPTQSREVGATIPLHVAVTIPPAPMVVGLTFRSGPAASAGEIAWIRTIRQGSNWERTTRKLRVNVWFRRSLR